MVSWAHADGTMQSNSLCSPAGPHKKAQPFPGPGRTGTFPNAFGRSRIGPGPGDGRQLGQTRHGAENLGLQIAPQRYGDRLRTGGQYRAAHLGSELHAAGRDGQKGHMTVLEQSRQSTPPAQISP